MLKWNWWFSFFSYSFYWFFHFFFPLLAQLCQFKVHFCRDCSCYSTWATVPMCQCQGKGSDPHLRKVRLKKTGHWAVKCKCILFFLWKQQIFHTSILHHLKAVTPLVIAWGLRKVRENYSQESLRLQLRSLACSASVSFETDWSSVHCCKSITALIHLSCCGLRSYLTNLTVPDEVF